MLATVVMTVSSEKMRGSQPVTVDSGEAVKPRLGASLTPFSAVLRLAIWQWCCVFLLGDTVPPCGGVRGHEGMLSS
jgi:hypothetical protein